MEGRSYSHRLAVAANQNIKEKNYWLKKLSGNPIKTSFHCDFEKTRGPEAGVSMGTLDFQWTGELFTKLMALSNKFDYTLHIIMVSGLVALLDKYTQTRDILIGSPIYKQEKDIEFINTVLVLRNRVKESMTFKELLLQAKQTVVEATEHQNYPLQVLMDQLNSSGPGSLQTDNTLFDIVLLLENIHDRKYIRDVDYRILFSFLRTDETIEGGVEFDAGFYRKDTIERIVRHFTTLVEKVVSNVNTRLEDIDILSEEEKEQILYAFNDTALPYPEDKTLVRLFEEQAARTPGHTALIGVERRAESVEQLQITYRELNKKSNRLAHFLRSRGVTSDTIVGVMKEPSIEMIVGLLGILKAGGAYLPIDPKTPANRTASMLEESDAPILLTERPCLDHLSFRALQDPGLAGVRPIVSAKRERIIDMDRLPLPDRSLIDYDKYNRYIGYAGVKHTISLEATRGCPYGCTYCHKIFPRQQVSRSAEDIFAEVEYYYNLGVRRFSIIDDIFNLNIKTSSSFFELMIKNGLKASLFFSAGLRGDILTKEYIDLMVEAGTVNMSPALETASPRLQKLINKNLNIEKFRENIEYICEKYPQVILELFIMHGFPTETEEEARQTLDFVKKLKWVHFPYINILRIYSTTEMAKFAGKHGISFESIIRSEDLAWHELPETLPFPKSFTLKYQADFLENYFLCRERLLHVLPYQMQLMTEDELVQKYDSYLPMKIDSFSRLLQVVEIKRSELGCAEFLSEDSVQVPGLNEHLKKDSTAVVAAADALRILLLDLDLYFSQDTEMLYDLVDEPLGLIRLMTQLNLKFGNRIDGRIAKSRIDFDNYRELRKLLEEFKPGLIGIRVLTFYRDFFHKTVSLIRQWGIDVPIIVGGPHVTTNYHEVLQDRNIDLAVLGEGEITLPGLVEKILANDGELPAEEVLSEIPGLAFIPVSGVPISKFAREIIMLDEAEAILCKESAANPDRNDFPGNLAYVIFTSGTTGKPKGAAVEHGNVTANLFAFYREFDIKSTDTVIQLSSYTFDASVEEIYPVLLRGGKLVIPGVNERLDIHKLVEFIVKHNVSIIDCTPLLLNEFNKTDGMKGIQVHTFISGGDVLKEEHVDRLLEAGKVYNTYGPTESTVCAAYYRHCGSMAAGIPIGKPIANYSIYILDENMRLLPVGVIGEICVSGPGVTRGYLNQPELTAEKFLSISYRTYRTNRTYSSQKIYKTGDLGRWLADGNIEYIGRKDFQVKIRGFRIETGEIETFLKRKAGIKDAVVMAREDKDGEKYLCAYCVSEYDESELKEFLQTELPGYMLPSFFVFLDKFPLTPAGKVDRRALPKPEVKSGAPYVEPQDGLQERVWRIWHDIFDLDRIGIYDNFFEIGGHSLRGIQVVNGIQKEFGVKLAIAEIFKHPTIKELSEVVKDAARQSHSPIEPVEEREYYELSHSQKRVWVVSQFEGGLEAFNIPAAYFLEGILDRGAFEKVFAALVERHESLRTVFITIHGEPKQVIKLPGEIGFKIETADLIQVKDGEVRAAELADAEENTRFDLGRGPLLRVKLLRLEKEKHVFLFTMHHIISDALSIDVLLSEMLTLYEVYRQGGNNSLEPLRIQYKDFAAWQNQQLSETRAQEHKNYWLEHLGGVLPVLELPADKERPEVMNYRGDTISLHLDEKMTRKLREVGQLGGQRDITLFMTLLAALDVLLYGYTGQTDIIVGTTTAGREHADLENQIGFYLNTLALRTRLNPEDTFIQLLEKTRDVSLASYDHQVYPFDKLVEDIGFERDISRHPIFNVMLNMINYNPSQTGVSIGSLRISPFEAGYHKTKFDLTVYVYERENTLTLTFEYNVDLFESKTILLMLKRFQALLGDMVRDFSIPISHLLLKDKVNLLPITPITPEVDCFDASYHQERLWFIDAFEAGHLYESSPIYHNMPLILTMSGPLDLDVLENSIRQVIARHKALRTRIVTVDNKPVQVVDPAAAFKLNFQEMEGGSGTFAEAMEQAAAECKRPFSMDKEPLIRGSLIRWEHQSFLLVITFHHITTDKKSLELFVRETALIYEALIHNKNPNLADLPFHYVDFSRWQSEFSEEAVDTLLFYWRRKLHGKLQALELPTDRPRAKIHTFLEARQWFTFPGSLTGRLSTYVQQEGVDEFVLLLSVFKVLLHVYCAQDEIIVGTVVDNRHHPGSENLMGPAANLLVLRSFISGTDSFKKVINNVQQTAVEAYRYRDMPFDRLVLTLNPDIDMSRTALFDVLFRYEEKPFLKISLGDVEAEVVETNLGWGKYDLNVLVQKKAAEEGEFLEGVLVYNADYYDASRMQRLPGHYRVLLEAFLDDPQQPVSSFEIVTPQEKQQLLREWNGKIAGFPQDRQIHEIFAHQAAQHPDHIAVEGAHELHELHEISITYSELERKSNQLTHLLREKGVLSDSIVAIMMDRSIDMIIGILGILKAGSAYLPIDPDYPQERIEYMLKDSNASLLLTGLELLDDCKGTACCAPTTCNLHLSLAYIIYTSGTTGRPKGVMVEHRNVVSLFFNDGFQFDFNGSDIWTMFHSHCFDFSVWEIFGALLYGGKLIVIPKMVARDTEQYVSLVRQSGVTVLNQTPSAFYRFIDVELRQRSRDLQVRYVIFGGEALTPGKLQEWKKRYPHTRLINMFGITETTVHVTYKEITDREIEENLSHIGKPIPTLTSYVMDAHQRLLPVGIYGELYVGGAGVSRGYLNQPQLTAERFPENPHRVGEILYRSGDLVRLLENGEMVYSGRIDHQVQLRGFRVELGEIQNQLLKIAGIRDAVVVDKEDASGGIYLCAYIVADEAVKAAEARQRLGGVLPDYMIPAYVIKVNKIPLTPNGKVDRKALPEPEFKAAGEGLVTPPDALQQKLVEIWADVLNIEKENIGINTSFFDMGGHSLKATILIANIHKELNVKLPLAQVFAAPTINELSAHIRAARTKRYLSIKPVEEKEYYPLSPAQKRLYVLHEMTPDNTSYNILYEIPLEAEVDKEELEAIFKRLIRRHEILRTSFEMVEGQPVQRIHPLVDFKIEYYDLITEAVCHYSPKAEVFDLSQAPLLRVKLIKTKTGENRQTLLLDMHHIITDAASQDIFRNEFMALRSKEELPDLRLQYKDYSEWHQIETGKEWIKEQENYWMSEFSGELPVLNLPADYSRPAVQTVEGNWVRFMLNPAETGILKSIAEENGVTLFMCLLAVFNVLLSKLSGQEDIIVGTPIAARRHADLQYVIGMLVNTLALRNYPSSNKTFKGFLEEIKQRTLEAFENQEYPFEDIVDKLSIHRDASRNPVFDVMLNVINRSDVTGEIDISGVPGQSPYHHQKGTSRFDITFSAFDLGERIYFSVEYSTALFTPLTIEAFITYLQGIIGFLSGNIQVKISDIEFIPWQEKEDILEISGGVEEAYDDKTIHRLFEEQVERTPDSVAVVGQGARAALPGRPDPGLQHLTYRELNRKSNQLARLLREKGVLADTVVGVLVERSIEMILALLAVLKAGGAYLPIDPRYPGQRILTMLNDSGVSLLLTTGPEILKNIPGIAFSLDRAETAVKEKNREILLLDEFSLSQLARYSFENPGHTNRCDNLLYVIYTSGSTGKPKGVMLEHRNFTNLIRYQYRHTDIDFSRVLQFTTISFDVAAQEIFSTLLAGGQLILIDNETLHEIPGLFRIVEREKIKTLFLPASFLKFVFNEEDYVKLVPGGLTHIVTAGEQVIVNERFRKYLRENNVYLHNHYGPSETHAVTALTQDPAGDIPELPSIGRPVSNTAIFILDRGMRLVPMGVPGELYIAGAQVGRGYIDQPELTEEKFIFIYYKSYRSYRTYFSKRNYKTGDLARWLPDRNLEFLGRLDHQVKIRGFRVELGEIETRLLNHRQIKECVVVSKEDEKRGRYLCAYIVSREELEIPELRNYLERDLPDYMVPSYFVFLDEIPLTPNRKVDRKALPAPELEAVDNYIAPENRMEDTLVEVWAEVLKTRKEMISVESNFFELGGHSLTATILAARVHKRFQVKLPLVEIFRVPTIRGLSHYLRDAVRDEYAYIEPVEEREYYVLSSAQKRLYILHRMNWSSTAYNMPEIIPLDEYPDLERLESAVQELVLRHQSLRTSFAMVNGEPVQRIYPHVEFKIEYCGFTAESTITLDFVRPFDLSRSPLFRVGLVETVGKKQLLLVDMHHIITDGTSNNILKEEFMALYAEEEMAFLRLQYRDFAQWQNLRVQQQVLRQQESYWLKEFSGKLPALDLPFDFPRPPQQRFEGNSIYFVMDEENTRQLRNLEVEAGATMYMVILSIYTILLSKLSGQEDIIVGTPTAGRRHADLERIIGMFVNTLPMRNYPLGRKTFIDFLREIKERTTSAFENQEYQFEDLVDRLSIPRDTSRNPIFDTMLNLLYPADYARENRDTPAFDESGLYRHSKGASKFDITLRVFEFGEKLLLNLEYAASLFKPGTIDRFIGYFKRIVTSAAGNPGQKIMEIEIIPEEKKREILFQFNEDLRDKHETDTIQHRLFGVFREYGNKTAIEYGAAQITYSELDKKSALISRWIIHHGIEEGSFIGICMDDKIDIITAMIGILEAGCVFVPLDTRLPAKRIEDMIAAAHIRIIFTNTGGENVLSNTRENNPGIRDIVAIEPLFYMTDERTGFENKAPTARYRREDNVYVYFTSGTGGRPHGIVGKNGSLLQFIRWEIDTFAVDETFRVSQLAAVGFDAFLRNVFTPLCAGGTVCIPGTRDAVMDSHGLVDWIDKNRINLVHCVPSVFRLINSEILTGRRFGHLKYIVMSGEQINPNELKRWYDIFDDRIQLVNCYGATETTIIKTFRFIQKGDISRNRIPAGLPIRNTRLIILNDNMNICDRGMVGEIYVRTAYSTSGYLNDPGLNAERFIQNPFGPGAADIIYKTGDLGRQLENGEIEILGRVDRQVKIRGLRIELGEIENQLLNHPDVGEAAVTIKEMESRGDDSEGAADKHLCAYIVPVEGEGRLSGKEKVRYQRQMLLDGWGIGSQERLKSSMVFVAGAGGTGSPTLMQLALCGFGTIVVCDDDVVDLSNLNRQFMHDETRIGMNKALSAKKTIERINPHINVIAHQEKVTRENLDRLAADAEIIFDCVDDLETKFILSEYAAERKVPHIVSVMIDISSYVAIFHPPATPCFSCIHDRDKLKDIIEMKKIVKDYKKNPFSVASPSLFVSAGAAVNEALKIILGFENPAYNRFLFFNHKGSAKIVNTEGYRQQTFSFSDHFRNICKEQGFDWDEGWRGNFLEELIITPDINCPVCSKFREDRIDRIDETSLMEDIDVEPEEKEPFAAKYRKYLSGILPDYMIPSFFISIEKIPLTPNGKIDWNALPEPGIGPGDNYTAPGTETEKKLAAIWSEILGIGVGINDNFFESGGHSLKAAHMIARIHQELKVKLPLAEVFKSPTVRQLAAVISNKEKTSAADIRGIEEREFYPLSYNQRRIWLVKQANPNDIFYNTTGRITFPHRVDEAVVKRVLFKIMARHEGLRTSFREKNGQPVQIIRKSSDINMPLRVADISALEANEKQQERERIFAEETRTPFDLSRAPLFRTVLVKLGPEQYDFIYTTYHIIADGWSLEVLRKDFLALYQGCRAGQNIEPEPLKVQCKEFAAWQARQLEDPEARESAHRYWRQKLKEDFPPLRLPYDFKEKEDTPGDNDNHGIIYRGVMGKEFKEALKALAAERRTSLFMVMFSLFNLLLARLSGQKDIVCRIPTAGRDHISLHPVVGHLMNPILVRNHVEDNDENNFINLLRRVETNSREALRHQWYPLERALEDLSAVYPHITVSFNMLNMYEGAAAADLENFDSFHRERVTDERFPLTLQIIEYRNAVELFWRYKNTLFKPGTIEQIAARYNRLIKQVTEYK